MDIGLETIVYLVLGLVFLVVQAGKKKKKTAPVAREADGEIDSDENRPPPSLLEEFLGMDRGMQPVEKPVHNFPEPSEENSPVSVQKSKSNVVIVEGKKRSGKEILSNSRKAELSEPQKRSSKRPAGFDLRRAVIYSAILDRKYF